MTPSATFGTSRLTLLLYVAKGLGSNNQLILDGSEEKSLATAADEYGSLLLPPGASNPPTNVKLSHGFDVKRTATHPLDKVNFRLLI